MKIAIVICTATLIGTALAQQPATAPAVAPRPPAPVLEGMVDWKLNDWPAILAKRQASGMPKVAQERFGTRNGYISFYCERRLEGEYPPESHTSNDEIIYLIDGEATLLVGGKQEGGADRGGTIFGGTIIGGKKQHITTGDMVSFPAGTPHQWIVDNPLKLETHIAIQTRKSN